MEIFAYHPFKGIYALGAIGFELARLPIWLIKYLTAYGRQNPEWSFRQALSIRVFFSIIHHIATVQVKTPLPLTPGKEKERFTVIKSAATSYYKGPLASNEDVKPIDIGASWYPAPLTTSSDTSSVTVILHLHGGAYVVGDGRTQASGYFASKLLKHAGATHIFVPQYRLSTLPANKTSNPFPAALQDSLTAYLYLTNTLHIPPSKIVLSGDSAGANAAIAILRYIAEYGPDLNIPAPSAAWLWSPWIQPSESIHSTVLYNNKNYNTDYLPFRLTSWGAHAYAGTAGPEILASPYISYKGKPFRTQVPVWVDTGSAEVLYFDDVEWAQMMKEAGNEVTLHVTKNVPHDVLLVGGQLGFDREATVAAKDAGEWLRGVRK